MSATCLLQAAVFLLQINAPIYSEDSAVFVLPAGNFDRYIHLAEEWNKKSTSFWATYYKLQQVSENKSTSWRHKLLQHRKFIICMRQSSHLSRKSSQQINTAAVSQGQNEITYRQVSGLERSSPDRFLNRHSCCLFKHLVTLRRCCFYTRLGFVIFLS